MDRDGWRCQECGKVGRLEVHHVQPLEHGGKPFELENLRTVCRGCHIKAHGGVPHLVDPGYADLVRELLP